jgi:sulfate permease, SulP family
VSIVPRAASTVSTDTALNMPSRSTINHDGAGDGFGETIKSNPFEDAGGQALFAVRSRRLVHCPPASLKGYHFKKLFLKDLVAGVTVGCMAVPQAMSYATVAGLPPIFGLYNAFIGLLPYFLFGSSNFLITGPTAVMSILVDGTIPKHPAHNVTLHTGADACDLSHAATELSVDCRVRVSMALTMSLLAGIFQVLLGYFRLGILSDLMSSPVIVGFTSGAAFLIASTQLSSILGITKCTSSEPCHHGLPLIDNVSNVVDKFDTIRPDTLLFGMCAMGLLIAFKNVAAFAAKISSPPRACCGSTHEGVDGTRATTRSSLHYNQLGPHGTLEADGPGVSAHASPRLTFLSKIGPVTLLVVSITCMMSFEWPLKTVGSVCDTSKDASIFHSECLPKLGWPSSYAEKHGYPLFAEDVINLIGPAIAVALVGYVESMSIAKTVAKMGNNNHEAQLDSNQELIALGACNMLCGLFSGYPVTGSFSRTAVNHASGAKTPVASVAAAITVGVALLCLTPLLQHVPKAALAAIVIVAILKLIKLWTAAKYYYLNRRDFLVFMVSLIATLILNIQASLVVAVLTSWVFHLVKHTQSEIAVVKVQHMDTRPKPELAWFVEDDPHLYANISALKEDFALVVNLRHSLEFSTVQHFRSCLERIAVLNLIPSTVILDFTNVVHVDVTGLEALMDAFNLFQVIDVPLHISAASSQVHETLMRFTEYDGEKHLEKLRMSRQTVHSVLRDVPKESAGRYTALSKTERTPGHPADAFLSP